MSDWRYKARSLLFRFVFKGADIGGTSQACLAFFHHNPLGTLKRDQPKFTSKDVSILFVNSRKITKVSESGVYPTITSGSAQIWVYDH
ncbi:hypothetical protein NPIL_523921 [Nephila pilipes]|uniref:Uncharacterized protein n=1 Tax=Nephila pilipes TaxID=299642 RepID=A0A8X6QR63_NEPPI|nr:hypothetical protein NPIL_523921 [Nephila pilipes]